MGIQKSAQEAQDVLNALDMDFEVDGNFDESYADDFDVQLSDDGNDVDDDDVVFSDDESYSDDYSFAKDKKKDNDEGEEELVVLEFDSPQEIAFTVPDLPGALDSSDIPEPILEVLEEEKEAEPLDDFDWKGAGGHKGFLSWLQKMINNTPKHSGHDVAGLERAIAFIESLVKEISKATRTDLKGEIDVNNCETIRDGMYKSLDRMEDRVQQIQRHKYPKRFKKKTSWVETSGLVKEGQKSVHVNGISIVVPLFISRLARVMINGMVSAGHSLEDQYEILKKEYDLTKREEAELQQLLSDMGQPLRQDRGLLNQQVDQRKSDNFDWAANYYS